MRTRVLGIAIAAALALAAPALAGNGHPWDGTWSGSAGEGGGTVQVIVAGDEVIGFFAGGDYITVTATSPLAADGALTFRWAGGSATLSVKGGKHLLLVRKNGDGSRTVTLTAD